MDDPNIKTGTVTIESIEIDSEGKPVLNFLFDKEFEEFLTVYVFKRPVTDEDIKKYVTDSFYQSVLKMNRDMIEKSK